MFELLNRFYYCYHFDIETKQMISDSLVYSTHIAHTVDVYEF